MGIVNGQQVSDMGEIALFDCSNLIECELPTGALRKKRKKIIKKRTKKRTKKRRNTKRRNTKRRNTKRRNTKRRNTKRRNKKKRIMGGNPSEDFKKAFKTLLDTELTEEIEFKTLHGQIKDFIHRGHLKIVAKCLEELDLTSSSSSSHNIVEKLDDVLPTKHTSEGGEPAPQEAKGIRSKVNEIQSEMDTSLTLNRLKWAAALLIFLFGLYSYFSNTVEESGSSSMGAEVLEAVKNKFILITLFLSLVSVIIKYIREKYTEKVIKLMDIAVEYTYVIALHYSLGKEKGNIQLITKMLEEAETKLHTHLDDVKGASPAPSSAGGGPTGTNLAEVEPDIEVGESPKSEGEIFIDEIREFLHLIHEIKEYHDKCEYIGNVTKILSIVSGIVSILSDIITGTIDEMTVIALIMVFLMGVWLIFGLLKKESGGGNIFRGVGSAITTKPGPNIQLIAQKTSFAAANKLKGALTRVTAPPKVSEGPSEILGSILDYTTTQITQITQLKDLHNPQTVQELEQMIVKMRQVISNRKNEKILTEAFKDVTLQSLLKIVRGLIERGSEYDNSRGYKTDVNNLLRLLCTKFTNNKAMIEKLLSEISGTPSEIKTIKSLTGVELYKLFLF